MGDPVFDLRGHHPGLRFLSRVMTNSPAARRISEGVTRVTPPHPVCHKIGSEGSLESSSCSTPEIVAITNFSSDFDLTIWEKGGGRSIHTYLAKVRSAMIAKPFGRATRSPVNDATREKNYFYFLLSSLLILLLLSILYVVFFFFLQFPTLCDSAIIGLAVYRASPLSWISKSCSISRTLRMHKY